MSTCISRTWGRGKERERQKNGSFPFHSLNPIVNAMLVSWPLSGLRTALLVWGTFDLPSSWACHMRNWLGAAMTLETCQPLRRWSPEPHSATSVHFATSLLTSLGTAEAFPVVLQSHHQLSHWRKRNTSIEYLPVKSTYNHLPGQKMLVNKISWQNIDY